MSFPVMHSASARFAYARFKRCGLGLWNPVGTLSLWKVSASTITRTGGESTQNQRHEAEQCAG